MAIDFPNAPVQGQVYTPSNQVPYTFTLAKDSWTGQIGSSTGFGAVGTFNAKSSDIITQPTQITGDGTENNPFLIAPSTSVKPGDTVWSTEYITLKKQAPGTKIRWIDHSTGAGLRFVQPYNRINKNGDLNLYLKYKDTPNSTIDRIVYTANLQLGPLGPYFRWVVTHRV